MSPHYMTYLNHHVIVFWDIFHILLNIQIELLVEWDKQFKDYGFYKFDAGLGKI